MDDDKQALNPKCLVSFYDHNGSLIESFEFNAHIVLNNIDIKDEWGRPIFHHWEAVAI
jgi:hypothetical protein